MKNTSSNSNYLELASLCKEIADKLDYLYSLDVSSAIKVSAYNSKPVREILDILDKSIAKKERKLGIKSNQTDFNL